MSFDEVKKNIEKNKIEKLDAEFKDFLEKHGNGELSQLKSSGKKETETSDRYEPNTYFKAENGYTFHDLPGYAPNIDFEISAPSPEDLEKLKEIWGKAQDKPETPQEGACQPFDKDAPFDFADDSLDKD